MTVAHYSRRAEEAMARGEPRDPESYDVDAPDYLECGRCDGDGDVVYGPGGYSLLGRQTCPVCGGSGLSGDGEAKRWGPLPNPETTFYYIGEDTKRAVMFDARRLEAERRERERKRAGGRPMTAAKAAPELESATRNSPLRKVKL